jgi:aldose 1-epimerase
MNVRAINRRAFAYICFLCILALEGLCMQAEVKKSDFGTMPDGTKISVFELQQSDLKVRITNYGARVVSLEVPDRDGKIADVVLGYDSLAGYLSDPKTYFGAIVGRYGNRIGHGTFVLDGKRYEVPKNDADNSLHGGTVGFDKRVWTAHEIPNGVELTLISRNGDQGYPGTLTTRVRYTVSAHALKIEYYATTDADTVLNLTNHSYFNLAGEGNGNILDNVLTIPADRYTPVNAGLIPTGELAPVAGTPFDFRAPTTIGTRIDQDNEQLKFAKGYDQNFVLGGAKDGQSLHEAARLLDPKSGRVLAVETTQPGVQFYSGNFLDGTAHGKHGHVYQKRDALCLETQHFPDSPNQPAFPSTELKPGQTFHSVTEYIFSTQK